MELSLFSFFLENIEIFIGQVNHAISLLTDLTIKYFNHKTTTTLLCLNLKHKLTLLLSIKLLIGWFWFSAEMFS